MRTLERSSSVAGRGLILLYVSLIVLIPLAALLTNAFNHGLGAFWSAATSTEALDALRLTVTCSLLAAAFNAAAGTATAFVLVRDSFWGKSALNAIVDLPFALPTVVAGVTFYTLYGPHSPFHVNITGSWIGITVAIMFVTLPFSVRAVQPVLESLSKDAEAAASTLGASSLYVFRTITFPAILPALLTGTGLAFARALGEYGSVVFISGNMPMKTEVAPLLIMTKLEQFDYAGATALAIVMLVASFLIILLINGIQWWSRRYQSIL